MEIPPAYILPNIDLIDMFLIEDIIINNLKRPWSDQYTWCSIWILAHVTDSRDILTGAKDETDQIKLSCFNFNIFVLDTIFYSRNVRLKLKHNMKKYHVIFSCHVLVNQ